MAENTDKKEARPPAGEVYAERRSIISGRLFTFLSGLLNAMPVADTSFITRHTGKSWSDIAVEMTNDPHIESCFNSRISGVAGKSWTVNAADDTPRAEEIAKAVNSILDQVPQFRDVLEHLLAAVPHGHAAVEVVWPEEPESGLWVPDQLKLRRYSRFTLSEDGKDVRLIDDESSQLTPVAPKKIIYHRYGRQDDYPFEKPLLLTLYWPWYFKKHAASFWMILAEKFGIPSIIGRYPSHFTDADVKTLVKALTNLQQDSVAAVPQDTEVDLQSIQVGEKGAFFRELLDFTNAEISKAVLGGTLTQEIGDKGSYAASQTHQEVRQDIIEKDASQLQETLDATLLTWLVEFNFGMEAARILCPSFKLNVEPERGTHLFAQTLEALSHMGVKVPIDFIAETFGLPADTEYEKKKEGASPLPFE